MTGTKPQDSPTKLYDLPSEILYSIFLQLVDSADNFEEKIIDKKRIKTSPVSEGLFQLTSTCKRLRNIFFPFVFDSIALNFQNPKYKQKRLLLIKKLSSVWLL